MTIQTTTIEYIFRAFLITMVAVMVLLSACVKSSKDGEGKQPAGDNKSDLTDSELSVGLGGISTEDVQAFRALADRFNGFTKSDLEILWQSDIQHMIYGNESFAPEFSAGLAGVTVALEEAGLVSGLADSPEPTGDELFDRYALAVHERLNAIGPDYFDLYKAGWVMDEELAEWEADFGDDPRYWELRYLCTRCNDPMQSDLVPDWLARGTGFLEEAVERRIATTNTYLLLCQDLRQCEARRSELTDPWADLPVELVDRIMDLLGIAVAMDDQQAEPLYQRAILHFELGEIELAMADLAAGNDRPVLEKALPFPIRDVTLAMHQNKPLGNAAVCGALEQVEGMSGYYSWRNHMEAALTSVSVVDTAECLDTWFDFVSRPGIDRGLEQRGFSIETDIFGLIISAGELAVPKLTDTQVKLLDRLRGWHEVVFPELMSVKRDNDWYNWEVPLIIAGKAHGDAVYFYLGEELEFRREAELLNPYFADLKDVSFTADTIPESMLEYEPFTLEDLEQRRREKREAREAGKAE